MPTQCRLPRARPAPRRPRPGRRSTFPSHHYPLKQAARAPVGSLKTASTQEPIDHKQRLATGDRVEDAHLPISQPQAKRGSPVAGSLKTASAHTEVARIKHDQRRAARDRIIDLHSALNRHHKQPAARPSPDPRTSPQQAITPTSIRHRSAPPAAVRPIGRTAESDSLLATRRVVGQARAAETLHPRARRQPLPQLLYEAIPVTTGSATAPRSRTAAVCPDPSEHASHQRKATMSPHDPLPHVRQAAGDGDGLALRTRPLHVKQTPTQRISIRRHATLALHE